ncbi:exonuclease domain-containing protein [bacterium]|nr:exonuclease domain-containing protein [bacterium]
MLPYNQKYLVFDTETEGLNLHSSRTWQVSWLICQGDRVLKENDRYINHNDLQINSVVAKMTGFTWEEYDQRKEPLKNVWADFKKDLFNPEYKVVGQNLLGFDVYMVAAMQRALGETPDYSYLERIYDTRAYGKAYREELDKPKDNLLSWQYKVIHDRSLKARVSQIQLLKFFGIDFDETLLHNALYDNQKCYEVFKALKKHMNL